MKSTSVNPVIAITGKDKECILVIFDDGRIFLRGELIGTDKELAEIIEKEKYRFK